MRPSQLIWTILISIAFSTNSENETLPALNGSPLNYKLSLQEDLIRVREQSPMVIMNVVDDINSLKMNLHGYEIHQLQEEELIKDENLVQGKRERYRRGSAKKKSKAAKSSKSTGKSISTSFTPTSFLIATPSLSSTGKGLSKALSTTLLKTTTLKPKKPKASSKITKLTAKKPKASTVIRTVLTKTTTNVSNTKQDLNESSIEESIRALMASNSTFSNSSIYSSNSSSSSNLSTLSESTTSSHVVLNKPFRFGSSYGSRFWRDDGSNDNGNYKAIIIGGIIGIIVLVLIIIVLIGIIIYHRRRRDRTVSRITIAKRPMKMKSADINAAKFQHGGVLVLDARLRGPVKHALDNQPTVSLHTIQFDSKLNEVVDIGSDVEIINERGTTTTVLTEGETEVDKKSGITTKHEQKASKGESQPKSAPGAKKAAENNVPETGSVVPKTT